MAERRPDPAVRRLLDQLAAIDLPALDELRVEEARTLLDETLDAGGDPEPVGHVRDATVPGPGGDRPVRVYRPDGEGPFPTTLYFHGGGFVVGDLESYDSTCRALANAADCVVASVDYRLAPEHPFPAAVAGTEWAADRPDVLGDVTDDLVVAGDSAGGTLAAVVALVARDRGGPRIGYQVLVYPAVSFGGEWPSYEENGEGYFLTRADVEWFGELYLGSEIHARNPYAAPLRAADHADLPPATVVTAEFDPPRDEGRAYADRLREAGAAVSERHYDGMIHGFVNMLDEPFALDAAREAIEAVAADLRSGLDA
jgi:acetyl esterase